MTWKHGLVLTASSTGNSIPLCSLCVKARARHLNVQMPRRFLVLWLRVHRCSASIAVCPDCAIVFSPPDGSFSLFKC